MENDKDEDTKVLGTSDVTCLDNEDNDVFDDKCVPQMKRLSCPTWSMLATELCERFSYYGIKAGLVLYFTQGLRMTHVHGKAWYHAFGMVSYFTGVVGAIMADSWLGKYKTIFYTLIVYSLAEIVLTLTSIPSIGQRNSTGPLLSLIFMAAACGNVKPCLGAFGGDQVNKKDAKLISTFFSMFYASVNVGATLAMIFAPMLRTDIQCYGSDCYPAVFGVNMIIIIMALLCFLTGRNGYVKRKPEGNMVVKVCKIIFYALNGKRKSTGKVKEHWLYYADELYKKREIDEVRALLKVLTMFIPLPVFWALFHQQGSSWTLQAEQMNGRLGTTELRSDQIQSLNPVLVLILIPLYDVVIYPALEKCGIKLSSLQRMVCGMVLAALSFAITGFVQMKIQDVSASPTLSYNSFLTLDFINVSPCEVIELKSNSFDTQILSLKYGEHSGYQSFHVSNTSLTVTGRNCYSKQDSYTSSLKLNLANNTHVPQIYQSVLFDINDKDIFVANVLEQKFPTVNLKKSDSRVRTIYVSGGNLSSDLSLMFKHVLYDQRSVRLTNFSKYDGKVKFIPASTYDIQIKESSGNILTVRMEGEVNLFPFGEYTIILQRSMNKKSSKEVVGRMYEDVRGTSVHRMWQLPQYIVVTAGEIMFSVTGLEFSYSQAPQSMKSVLQSFWMLSVAFGDLVVVLISVINPVDGIVEEMFLYGGIMVVVAIIFAIMCIFYTYNDFSGSNDMSSVDDHENDDDDDDDDTKLTAL